MFAATLHFEMVVSGGKVADLQRGGIALKFGRILHNGGAAGGIIDVYH